MKWQRDRVPSSPGRREPGVLTSYIMKSKMSADALLEELRKSGTDLERLVEHVVQRRPTHVAVSSESIAAWERRAPEAWAKVRTWLKVKGVTVVTV